jgi:hypothetical protein
MPTHSPRHHKHDNWHFAWFLIPTSFYNDPGCYVVYTDGVPIYIGQTISLKLRFRRYAIKPVEGGGFDTPWGYLENMRVKVKYARRYGEQAMLELRLIRRLQRNHILRNTIKYRGSDYTIRFKDIETAHGGRKCEAIPK